MTRAFNVAASVSHERLDDEVIAIDLQTGVYYALDDAAADCWSIAVLGGGIDEMVACLADRYAVDRSTVLADVTPFVAELVECGLLIPVGTACPIDLHLDPTPAAYQAPVLARYDDLETLLLIDPIHEVDEAGWPMQPSTTDGG